MAEYAKEKVTVFTKNLPNYMAAAGIAFMAWVGVTLTDLDTTLAGVVVSVQNQDKDLEREREARNEIRETLSEFSSSLLDLTTTVDGLTRKIATYNTYTSRTRREAIKAKENAEPDFVRHLMDQIADLKDALKNDYSTRPLNFDTSAGGED